MQKTVKRKLTALVAVLCLTIIITVIFAGELVFFDPAAYSTQTAARLKIREDVVSNYPFPPVKASIFSSFIVIIPEAPKQAVKKVELPPVDPYEAVNRDLKSFSFFGKSGDSVFLAKGDNMYTVKTGDKIEDKYIVKEIKDTAVIVGLVGDDSFKFEIISK